MGGGGGGLASVCCVRRVRARSVRSRSVLCRRGSIGLFVSTTGGCRTVCGRVLVTRAGVKVEAVVQAGAVDRRAGIRVLVGRDVF